MNETHTYIYKTAYWTGALLSEVEVDFTLELVKYQRVHSCSYIESDLTGVYAYKAKV